MKEYYSIEGLDEAEAGREVEYYTFPNRQSALDFIQFNGGNLFTQVDGEKNRYYDKGDCLVNRTGIYAVIFEVKRK